MKLMNTLSAGVAAIAITTAFTTVVAPTPAHAQQTTADVRGVVTDGAGAPISGASVSIVNTNTGASRLVTTDSSGRFSATNLSVSGEYTVTATASGYQGKSVESVGLSLGDTSYLTFALSSAGASADEIVVVATRSVVADLATGPSATFTSDDLDNLPNFNRDIKDIIRLDPRINIDERTDQGNGIYCAGGNNRANSLTVDGVKQNDDFGLNDNGYPTQRMPFPYDVVEQVSVELAPFDVEYGSFTGCNINVVTKSGSNELHGGMFLNYDFALMNGASLESGTIDVPRPSNDAKQWGGSLSGPIIKDRLFFTFAYEKFSGSDTVDVGYAGSGVANEISSVTQADYNQVLDISRSVYNYDPLEYFTSAPTSDRRYFAKIDAYITEDHRLELAYQNTDGSQLRTWDLFTGGGGNFSYPSHWYQRGEKLRNYSGRLFSDWTDNFSTELKVSYQDRETIQDALNGTDFAWMEIGTDDGGTIHVGPDPNRHANQLKQDTLQIKAKGAYQTGAHLFTFGYELEQLEWFNVYAFNSEGHAEFDSIADYAAQMPSFIEYSSAPTNDKLDTGATVERLLHSIYLQDEFTVSPTLNLTAGLRYDFFSGFPDITENAAVEATYGVPNTATLDSTGIIQPRVAFDWQAMNNLRVTGGVGRFSGGDPSVWISNTFQNTGINSGYANNFSSGVPVNVGDGFDGYTIPAALQDANTASALAGTGSVALLDPDFKIPSIWRFSLGAQYTADLGPLGEDWLIGADALYTLGSNPYNFVSLSQQEIATAPDGRPIYEEFSDQEVYMLTNADTTPKSLVLSAYFDKTWEFDNRSVHFNFGYAYSDVEEVHGGTSSTAWSSFEGTARVDINRPFAANSNYMNKHALRARLDLEHRWSDDVVSRVSFFGSANSGRPYSYTLDTNLGSSSLDGQQQENNLYGDYDTSINRQLPYIPLVDDPLVAFASAQVEEDFNRVLAETGLDAYRGEYAPRNGFYDSWYSQLDMRFEQTFPGVMDGHTLTFFTNINNLPNLLNDEWGVFRSFSASSSYRIVDLITAELDNVDPSMANQIVITDVNTDWRDDEDIDTGLSVWSVQFGLRYDF